MIGSTSVEISIRTEEESTTYIKSAEIVTSRQPCSERMNLARKLDKLLLAAK